MKLSWRHFTTFSFWFELFCFMFSLNLAISLAQHLSKKTEIAANIVQPMPAWQFLLSFLIATIVLLLILKYWKNPWLIKLLFYGAILEGLWLFASAYYVWPYYLYFLAAALFLWTAYRNVLIHDLILIVALSAIALIFGANIRPSSGVLILLALAVYDYWAVYKTTHMVKMFSGLAESKVYFTLIIPHDWRGLNKKMDQVSPHIDFMFLGTGDLAIPAIFIVSCLQINILTAWISAIGAILGFIFLYILFVTQKEKQPMPGLPAIVLGTLLGFLVTLIIEIL